MQIKHWGGFNTLGKKNAAVSPCRIIMKLRCATRMGATKAVLRYGVSFCSAASFSPPPPPWGGIVLATSRNTQDEKLPLGVCFVLALGAVLAANLLPWCWPWRFRRPGEWGRLVSPLLRTRNAEHFFLLFPPPPYTKFSINFFVKTTTIVEYTLVL